MDGDGSAATAPAAAVVVEGCEGIGRHLAQRLVADGEHVVDVPAKLSTQPPRKGPWDGCSPLGRQPAPRS